MAKKDIRKLDWKSEARFAPFRSEHKRDRRDALRQIESLNQSQTQIAQLGQHGAQLAEQTALLRYMCERLVFVCDRLEDIEQLMLEALGVPEEAAVDTPPPSPPPAAGYPPPPSA